MLRVRTQFSGVSGAPYLSTFYFVGADSATEATDANAAVGSFWNAVDGLMHTSVTWTTMASVDILTASGTLTGVWGVTPQTGAGSVAASGLLPHAIQGLLVWDTGAFINGRRLRGRTFIPGLTEAANVSNSWDATSAATVTTAATTLNALNPPQLAVWSRANNTVIAVSTVQLSAKWAVLRSRRD